MSVGVPDEGKEDLLIKPADASATPWKWSKHGKNWKRRCKSWIWKRWSWPWGNRSGCHGQIPGRLANWSPVSIHAEIQGLRQSHGIARFDAMAFVFDDRFSQSFCASLYLLGIHGHTGQFGQQA